MHKDNTAHISEIFDSIQGEGRYVGARQIFVRLAGCPLSCSYCDTDHTPQYTISAQDLAEKLTQNFDLAEYHSISFTGGEPLLYPAFLREISQILSPNIKLFLETSGHEPKLILDMSPYFDFISVDLKTNIVPFDKHADRLLSAVGLISESKVYLKFVLKTDEDENNIDIAIKCMTNYGIKQLWLHMVDNKFDEAKVNICQRKFM
jgi:organic radical activating enzyme